MSSGLGPFYASSSLGGGQRRTSTRRTTGSRAVAPSAAQWERARRQAERARQEAEREAAVAELRELRRRMTSVHLESFPVARPPVVPNSPQLGLPWALAEARAFHLEGVGRLARAQRGTARQRAEQDAPVYLAAETARLREIQRQLTAEADHWWRALLANDEDTVCEAVNSAFSDNPAAGCAVGVDGDVLSVVVRQPDLDSLPDQTAGLTPGGRPTLKRLTKRERVLWWLTALGANVVATLKEGFATAPGVMAIDLAVLTRLPDTQRLGFVAYGRWTRQAVESTPWREPEDALRFQDIGQDVVCSVSATASGSGAVKALSTGSVPGLQSLLDHAQDESDLDVALGAGAPDDGRAVLADPYRIRPFAEWRREAGSPTPVAGSVAAGSPTPGAGSVTAGSPTPGAGSATAGSPTPGAGSATAGPPPVPAAPPVLPASLVPGQTLVLPEDAWQGLSIAFGFAGAEADLTLFLTGEDGRVSADEDFVFYHQPFAADGAVRLLGKRQEGPCRVERATVHLAALPERVRRVAVAINMDVDTGLSCGSLTHAALHLDCVTGAAWAFRPAADPDIRAMVVVELYRHTVDGSPVWKLRALGQGWADGLDGLARAYGVDVE
ncbi:TerD family protein [Streptomyces sp. NPDC004539]|uniref:TerD family protein n=1 Tax=Streptomyces sp. NPDC004539 TaxID=3154280 RepID=UPI0033BE7F2D